MTGNIHCSICYTKTPSEPYHNCGECHRLICENCMSNLPNVCKECLPKVEKWRTETKACKHLRPIIKEVAKMKFIWIVPDYYPDTWECVECDVMICMQSEVYKLRGEKPPV